MIARFLGKLLSINPNERDGVLYFFLVMLVFSFGASFARSIGMTLLIGELGGDKLPITFIFIDLMVMMGSLVYAHYTKSHSGLAILGFMLLSTAIFSLITQVLFILTTHWWTQQAWVYGFFFVGFFFFNILISIHFGSVVASYFNAVQVKRVTPVVNAGIPIGGALGGGTLFVLLSLFQFQPQYLIVTLGATCLGAFGLLHIIKARLSPVRAGDAGSKSHKNPIDELTAALKYIIGSRLMIYMSVGLVLFVIANKLLEYHYQTIIYFKVFPDETERATFFATYEIFANLAWLVVQLFFTSRIAMTWGVGASNVLYPVLSAVVALALFIYFSLVTGLMVEGYTMMLFLGVLTQFVNQEMRGALRTPLNNLLFNAIPPNQWGTNKAFLNGMIFPLSTVFTGAFLIMITGNVLDSTIAYLLPLIALIVSILGILVALPQWAAYDQGMINLLRPGLFGDLSTPGTHGPTKLKQIVQQKLNSTDPYNVTAALEMIRVLRLNDFVNQVGNLLLRTQAFKVKECCINTLAALSQSSITYLVEALRTETDAQVLPLILRNLAQFKSVNYNNTIEKLLTHPAAKVFVEACLYLYNHPSYMRKAVIENKIIARLANTQSPDTALYLYALGEMRQSSHVDTVLPFLESDRQDIRLAAFTAFIRMLERELEPHKPRLIKALDSPDKNMKIVALRALKECQPLDDWSPVIRLLGEKDRALVTESKELLRLSLSVCKPALFEKVFSENISVQQRFEILSLVYSKFNDEQQQRLQEGADKALRKFVEVNGLLKLHESRKRTSKTHDLIAKVLQEIALEHLHHVLTIITFVSQQNIEFFQRVSRGLQSPSRANQGNALEVLSNAREKFLVSRVLKYYDERLNDFKAINRIHITLFGEPLDIDGNRQEAKWLTLNNNMLKACLIYMVYERTGVLKLKNTNDKVRELLTER
jgi:ATP/ADP translocase/HEAT repeat protein